MSLPTHYAIDFGTSNSLLAAANAESVFAPLELDPHAPDPTVLRSILYFPDERKVFYGHEALVRYAEHDMEGRLIRSTKKHLPVRSFVGTFIGRRPMNLEDLIGAFLREMKRRADEHYGVDVRKVVLGRPAKFSLDTLDDAHAQNRLDRAARVAGFEEIHFCPEPVAAARQFRLELDSPKTVLVADFGGGTSDFTVLRLRPDGYATEDVLAIGGVNLAGDSLDGAIMRKRISKLFGADVRYRAELGSNDLSMPVHLMEKICSPADISLLRERDTLDFFQMVRKWALRGEDKEAMDRLFCLIEEQQGFQIFEAIETTKRELSSSDCSVVKFDYPGIHLSESVTRPEFDAYTDREIGTILDALDETMRLAAVDYAGIDIVCCTGGTAKVPRLAEGIRERFGAERMQEFRNFHSVVGGLAEQARDLAGR